MLNIILINPNFTKFILGFAVNKVGSWFRRIAIIGLLYKTTHSASVVGISFIITYAPTLFGGLFSAKFIDKYQKRNLMVCTNLASFLCAMLLFLCINTINLFLIFGLLLLLSVADAIYEPAKISITPEIISNSNDYSKAVAYLRVTRETTMLLSTAFGGILIAFVGLGGIFLIDAVTYLISSVFNYSIKETSKITDHKIEISHEKTTLLKNIKIAWKETFAQKILTITLFLSGIRQFTYGIAVIAFTMIVFKKFHLNETWLGWSYMVGGMGSILGGALVKKFLHLSFLKELSNLYIILILSLLNSVMLFLMFISPVLSLFMVMILLHDIFMIMTEIISETNIIKNASEDKRGRVSSLFFSIESMGFLAGAIVYTLWLSNYDITYLGWLLLIISLFFISLSFYFGCYKNLLPQLNVDNE